LATTETKIVKLRQLVGVDEITYVALIVLLLLPSKAPRQILYRLLGC
jgi:hypothetical protein